MVICGERVHISLSELCGSERYTGFPDPDLFDHLPIRFVAFSHVVIGLELFIIAGSSPSGSPCRIPIVLILDQHSPDCPRHFVRERDGDQHLRLPCHHPLEPRTGWDRSAA
jgi:hypothetical protein